MDSATVEALGFVGFMLTWQDAHLPVRVDGAAARWTRSDRLAALVAQLPDADLTVGLACPQPDGVSLTQSPILWAWITGADQEARAHRFRPPPSFVLRVGSTTRRLLVWALATPIVSSFVEAANRKLAYALHARQAEAAPERFWMPLPGTMLHDGRTRPAPLAVTRMNLDGYDPKAILGRLKEPPPRDAWRERRAA